MCRFLLSLAVVCGLLCFAAQAQAGNCNGSKQAAHAHQAQAPLAAVQFRGPVVTQQTTTTTTTQQQGALLLQAAAPPQCPKGFFGRMADNSAARQAGRQAGRQAAKASRQAAHAAHAQPVAAVLVQAPGVGVSVNTAPVVPLPAAAAPVQEACPCEDNVPRLPPLGKANRDADRNDPLLALNR